MIPIAGVAPDLGKVREILDLAEPRSLMNLKGFLRITDYCRHFVRHYATLTTPLTEFLRSIKFAWSTQTYLHLIDF